MSSTRIILDPQRVADGQQIPFDFSSKIPNGQSITAGVVAVSVWSGNDPNPSALLSNTTSFTSTVFTAMKVAGAGVAGTIYLLRCTATLSASVAVLEALLAVLPDGI